MPPNIAVIGTGAAALGVTAGIMNKTPDARITYFDVPDDTVDPPYAEQPPQEWPPGTMRQIIGGGRSGGKRGLMPNRSHFSATIPETQVTAKRRLYHGRNRGGLTRFWTAGMFPLAPDEFADWPVTFEDMKPYYLRIAETVGVSGGADRMDDHFGFAYVNRPPITRLAATEHLASAVNAKNDPNVFAGVCRVSIDTRPGSPSACVACGECLTGCFRNAILYAPDIIDRLLADKTVGHVADTIRRVERNGATCRLIGASETYDGFDHVFVAAGCLGSAEIALRSLDLRRTPVPLYDNPMYLFPAFRPLSNPFRRGHEHLSVANHVVVLLPETADEGVVYAPLNPVPDLMMRSLLPEALWGLGTHMGRMLRNSTAVVKFYLDSTHAHQYAVSINDADQLSLQHVQSPDAAAVRAWAKKRFGRMLGGTGWVSLYWPFLDAATSAHYAGPLAYGNEVIPVSRTGSMMPGVHVCDSAVFPATPAQPLTYTIMANAMRTAEEVLDG